MQRGEIHVTYTYIYIERYMVRIDKDMRGEACAIYE